MRGHHAVFLIWILAPSCTPSDSNRHAPSTSLRDRARNALKRGAREAAVPYAADEEEGEMLIVTLDDAVGSYRWIVGEPVEERTFAEPDSIFTVYRFRIEQHWGNSKDRTPADHPLYARALRELPPRSGEVLVIKSGGNLVVDGVLLKKRGSLCFSELMPRRYLLGLSMDSSGRIGWLSMGCRGIFAADGDRLTPRAASDPFITAVKERFGNSLAEFSRAVQEITHAGRP